MADTEPLTTLDLVKDELGLTGTTADDAYLDRQIKAGSRTLTSLAGRVFHRVEDETVKAGSQGGRYLMLNGFFPVTSIKEIRLDGTVIDPDLYDLEEDNGMIRHLGSGGWTSTKAPAGTIAPQSAHAGPEQAYEIDFDAGWATPQQVDDGAFPTRGLPYDLEQAVIDYVVGRYHKRGRSQDVASKSLGDGSIKWVQRDGRQVPETFIDIVHQYGESGGVPFV